jgi:hypothetical protein
MSSNPNSYLTDLLQKASEYRTRQLEMQRKQFATKSRARPEPIQTNYNLPFSRTKMEQDTRNRTISGSEVTNILSAAKEFNPFASTKTEEQLKEPLTYFDTLSKSVSTGYLDQTKSLVEQRENLIKQRDAELKNIPQSISGVGFGSTRGTGGRRYQPNQVYTKIYQKYQQQLQPIEQQISRLGTINQNIYSSQIQNLSNLSTELKKYYGSNFENVSKEQLAVADLGSFQSLTGDIAKYTSLRDSYIKKYQQTGSKVDMDWIKQYNDLLNSTSKSISEELPKTFASASRAVSSIKESQASTLSALEALNKVSGVQASQKTILNPNIDAAPIGREQAIARQKTVSQYSERAKPAPKFTQRPM